MRFECACTSGYAIEYLADHINENCIIIISQHTISTPHTETL